MAPSVDALAPSSLWAEDAAVTDDVLGIGCVCGSEGLSLSEATVASNKKQGRPVKGCAGKKEEEVVKGEAEAGCSNPVGVVAGDAVEEAPTEKKRLTALPDDEVQWILAQKPLPISLPADREHLLKFYPPEMIDRIVETDRRAAEASAAMQDEFLALQDRARKQYRERGVVEVDDEFLARREQTCQWLRELFDDVFTRMETELNDSDFGNYSDMYATDDEEEEEQTSNRDDEGF